MRLSCSALIIGDAIAQECTELKVHTSNPCAGYPLHGRPLGEIDVQSLVVRYRRDLDPVLNGITFSVKGAEPRQLLRCRSIRVTR